MNAQPQPEQKFTLEVPVVTVPGQEEIAKENLSITRFDPRLLSWRFASMNLENLTDDIAKTMRFVAALEKWTKAAKEAYSRRLREPEDKLTPTIQKGLEFQAIYSKRERTDIDRDRIKTEMGADWYAAHCKTSSYFEMRFRPLEENGDEQAG